MANYESHPCIYDVVLSHEEFGVWRVQWPNNLGTYNQSCTELYEHFTKLAYHHASSNRVLLDVFEWLSLFPHIEAWYKVEANYIFSLANYYDFRASWPTENNFLWHLQKTEMSLPLNLTWWDYQKIKISCNLSWPYLILKTKLVFDCICKQWKQH